MGQPLAALRSAKGQNLTAIRSLHSLAETVHLAALALLGLIGSEHGNFLLSGTSLQSSII